MNAPSAPSKDDQERYQAEQDLRTLSEAARIRSDKARSEAVLNLANEQSETAQDLKGKK